MRDRRIHSSTRPIFHERRSKWRPDRRGHHHMRWLFIRIPVPGFVESLFGWMNS